MSIKKAQDNSSYLSNINIGKGLISIKTENNKEFIETNLGAGLKYDNNKIIVDPDAQLNITFSTALSTQNYRYYDDETETLTVDYTKIQLNGGTVYYNNLQKIVIESYPQNQHMLIPVLQTLDEPGEYELPAIGTRYIYYSLSDQDIVIITTNALDSNNNYIPVSTITTGYDDTSEKYITLAIYDNRPSISWNTYASPDYLPSSKVGEIVRFKADYDPGPNFIKADGRTIPDAYPSLQKIYGSTVPTIPSANGTDFYVRARLESGFVISPDSYWSTELYHLANLDLMIEAYYYTTTDVKLSDNELNDLYTNGFPIINKASSSVTQPYKYILTFPQAINNGQLSVHNAETHDIKWNVDGDKVYIVASDAQTSIGEFDFYGSMSNVAMALNKWDTYATEDLTPEPDTTVLSIPFLLYNKNVDVYKNGQLLKSSEWSVTSNNSIQLVTPANGTDWFRVVSTAKLPTHAHQHMPNYESEWLELNHDTPGLSVQVNHNLNLTDPRKSTYILIRKTADNEYVNFNTIYCSDLTPNSVKIYLDAGDTEITHVKLVILANQYNNNALPWYGESGSTIDLEEMALVTESDITARTLISSTTNTSPIDVQSTVKVTNLNSDLLDGLHAASTNTASTVVARDASGNFSANVVNFNAVKIDSVTTVDKNSNGEIRTTTNELIATKFYAFGGEETDGSFLVSATPVLRKRFTNSVSYYNLDIKTNLNKNDYETMYDITLKYYSYGIGATTTGEMEVRLTGDIYPPNKRFENARTYIKRNTANIQSYTSSFAYVDTNGKVHFVINCGLRSFNTCYAFVEVYCNIYHYSYKSYLDNWDVTFYDGNPASYDTDWGIQWIVTEGDTWQYWATPQTLVSESISFSAGTAVRRYVTLLKPIVLTINQSSLTDVTANRLYNIQGNHLYQRKEGDPTHDCSCSLMPGRYQWYMVYSTTGSRTVKLEIDTINNYNYQGTFTPEHFIYNWSSSI